MNDRQGRYLSLYFDECLNRRHLITFQNEAHDWLAQKTASDVLRELQDGKNVSYETAVERFMRALLDLERDTNWTPMNTLGEKISNI